MNSLEASEKQALKQERWEFLEQIEDWLEMPMLILGFVWLVLLIIDLIWGVNRFFEVVSNVIWIIFVIDFAVRFFLAPNKLAYLKNNWLTAISLVLPALRILRIARVLRVLQAIRGVRLVRVVSSLNRGMRSLRASMTRRGFGYVIALTLIVALVGAAGMYAFENNNSDGRGLNNYGTALWWTAMIMTTMGSEYWPQTPEGRVLCFLLALYAFAVFGYVTATLATFFVGRDADDDSAEIAGAKSIEALQAEIKALRKDIQALSAQKSQHLE